MGFLSEARLLLTGEETAMEEVTGHMLQAVPDDERGTGYVGKVGKR